MPRVHHFTAVLALTVATFVGCGPKEQQASVSTPGSTTQETSTEPPTPAPTENTAPTPADSPPPKSPSVDPPRAEPPDDGPGLAVGETLSIELKDQSGNVRTLADLAGDGLVALVFHRSADW